MKTKWKLLAVCALIGGTAMAQTSHKEFNFSPELEEEYKDLKGEDGSDLYAEPIFDVNYYNKKIYFNSDFGTDNSAIIDIYTVNSEFVMSIVVQSTDAEEKPYIWNEFRKYEHKLDKGNYIAVYTAKGKKSSKKMIKIN